MGEANAALLAAQEDEGKQNSAVRAAESRASEAERAFDTARKNAESAADVLQIALRVQASAATADRRKELHERLESAEALRRQSEEASADAKKEISDRDLTEIEKLDEDLRVMKRTRGLEAASITMQYAEDRQGGVSLDGVALPDRQTMPIPDGAELEIESIGRLVIQPGRKAKDGSLAEGEAKLAAALQHRWLSKVVAQARDSALRRRQAEEHRSGRASRAQGRCPKGD